MSLPTDAAARKAIPVYSGFVVYFPDAIAAVAQLSQIANEQHNPGTDVHWDRSKSKDELDAMMRHTLDMAKGVEVDTDEVLHATKQAWRSMANLQKLLESKKAVPATSFGAVPDVEPIAKWCEQCGISSLDMKWTPVCEREWQERNPVETDYESRWLMRDDDGTTWETLAKYTKQGIRTFRAKALRRVCYAV